ncbi:TrmH family RNA methyltransferase [Rubrimonas cliftonensis]|uniref:chorismate mutase n=1 Tax=Rubrimonas cliftonensis TaxID=89524 RepID=A0A1H3VL34_9RHOB|nr:RNA methyltransferase, TrmH family, group 1/chorismate mutase related enzymes [Rubrimonas cliftonensis]
MSGTDSSKLPHWDPDGPAIVLVRPQLGENIGAAARAMWNFGLRRLRLVEPRDGWPNPKAVAMASGAAGVLDEARVFTSTAQAVADCACVYATTARPRDIAKPVLEPAEAVRDMRGRIAAGQKVAVLMGPERTGLETDDIVQANVIVSVRTNPAFASINLAQATLLMAYEWRNSEDVVRAPATPDLATGGKVAMLLDHLSEALARAGYFRPPHKAPAMRRHIDNIFRRAPLTEQDVRTLRGAVRALDEGPRRAAERTPVECADMSQLREGIDAIDAALMRLFAERTEHIERAAELKRRDGLPALIPERVEEVVRGVRAKAEGAGLDAALYETIWRLLIDHAIALEEARLASPRS